MPDRDAVQVSEVGNRGAARIKAWSKAQMSATSIVPPGFGGEVRVLSFAPAEWLVVSKAIEGPRLAERLRQHMAGQGMAVVDLSCAVNALRVDGSAARDVLTKGCGLDLHPRVFPAGHCTRTRFAQLPVIVDCIDPKPCFDLYVSRSYLKYLQSWLVDAAVEFQSDPRINHEGSCQESR